jgi:aminopeptidase N
MRKYITLVLLLNIALLSAAWISASAPLTEGTRGAPGVGDPYFPELGNGGYDAQHFRIGLTVDLNERHLAGTVTMQAIATQDLSQFNLDFLGFSIEQLTVNGVPATYSRAGREFIITPAVLLAKDSPFEVLVRYQGTPGQYDGLSSQPFSGGWQHYPGGVYVASQPDGASLWYPTNDHPQDKATYSFAISVDAPYIVATNGQLQRVEDDGAGRRTFYWETRDPTAS